MAVVTALRPIIRRPYRMNTPEPGVIAPSALWYAATGLVSMDGSGNPFEFVVFPVDSNEAQRVMWSLEGISISDNNALTRLWEFVLADGERVSSGAADSTQEWNQNNVIGALTGSRLNMTRHGASAREPGVLPNILINPRKGGSDSWSLTCSTANVIGTAVRFSAWGFCYDQVGPSRGLLYTRPD